MKQYVTTTVPVGSRRTEDILLAQLEGRPLERTRIVLETGRVF